MAKIKKCKLSWQPSDSMRITGYRLYWSKEERVDYDCAFIELGNVCEAYLPDVLGHAVEGPQTLRFGITAVDDKGNESDITLLGQPYQMTVPSAPSDLLITMVDSFHVMEASTDFGRTFDREPARQLEDDDAGLMPISPPKMDSEERGTGFYEDVGYRKSTLG